MIFLLHQYADMQFVIVDDNAKLPPVSTTHQAESLPPLSPLRPRRRYGRQRVSRSLSSASSSSQSRCRWSSDGGASSSSSSFSSSSSSRAVQRRLDYPTSVLRGVERQSSSSGCSAAAAAAPTNTATTSTNCNKHDMKPRMPSRHPAGSATVDAPTNNNFILHTQTMFSEVQACR